MVCGCSRETAHRVIIAKWCRGALRGRVGQRGLLSLARSTMHCSAGSAANLAEWNAVNETRELQPPDESLAPGPSALCGADLRSAEPIPHQAEPYELDLMLHVGYSSRFFLFLFSPAHSPNVCDVVLCFLFFFFFIVYFFSCFQQRGEKELFVYL